ncbi:MAG: NUDIX domain-containing protein, partial [Planctomycetaceae bacterium]|nr:NUDIX domain-containing protein [Planctomycetaceae bacterium]
QFPRDPVAIAGLPGIGRYTAGAIASFAFDLPAPIVEANTLRLYCRLMGFDGNPRSAAGQRLLWEFAGLVLPRAQPGDFNQALMELGATVCRIQDPGCDSCPVRTCCRAAAEGTQLAIPVAATRPEVTRVTEMAIAVRKEDRWLLRQRRADERWSGMWDFPRFPVDDSPAEQLISNLPAVSGSSTGPGGSRNTQQQSFEFSPMEDVTTAAAGLRDLLTEQVRELCGVTSELSGILGEFPHTVTRYRIRLICLAAECTGEGTPPAGEVCQWFDANELPGLPLSASGRRMAKMLPWNEPAAD